MAAKVHVGDVGTIFEATVRDQDDALVDVRTATTLQMLFKKPDGSLLTKAATVVNVGVLDGKIKYVSIAGDIDQAGEWFSEGRVVTPVGDWGSDVGAFTVDERLHA